MANVRLLCVNVGKVGLVIFQIAAVGSNCLGVQVLGGKSQGGNYPRDKYPDRHSPDGRCHFCSNLDADVLVGSVQVVLKFQ